MIEFTELKVEGESLIIKASVRDLSYYDNVYINKIVIDTQDTFSSSGPSSSPIYTTTISGNQKSVELVLSSTNLSNVDLKENLFFVYAVAKGTPSASTPCGMDNINSIGVTYAKCPIFNTVMRTVKEMDNSCVIPVGFIDSILRYKALEYAIASKHYLQAIYYYNKFYKNLPVTITSTCGCHG